MAMRFIVTIEVTVEHITGKFASRDEIEQLISDTLSESDPGSFTCDEGGEYETSGWEVTDIKNPSK